MEQNRGVQEPGLMDVELETVRSDERTGEIGDERRAARRARRRRYQMIAYSILAAIVVLAIVIVVAAVHIASSKKNYDNTSLSGETLSASREPSVSEEQSTQAEQVEALFADEEELVVSEEPVEETVQEPTREQKLDEIVDAAIEVMPIEDKVAGLFIVQPESLTGVATVIRAGDNTRDALAQYAVGGIIYFNKNIQSADQLKEMIETTQSYSRYPLFIAVDEEGGSVSRIADSGLAAKNLSAEEIAEGDDPEMAHQVGRTIGAYLNELGFNLNFAPVADLGNVSNSILGSRTYGDTAEKVTPYVLGMMNGLEEQQIVACLKHFPGCGSITQDTHSGIAMSERTKEQFYAEELEVFRAGIDNGAKMIMVGHMSAPYLTLDSIPCSLSSVIVTDILRGELGYDGVVITDAMNMAAITEYHTADEAAVLALKAGCDMILMPENFNQAYEGVLQAVKDGVIAEERINDSLRRIYRIKYADKVN